MNFVSELLTSDNVIKPSYVDKKCESRKRSSKIKFAIPSKDSVEIENCDNKEASDHNLWALRESALQGKEKHFIVLKKVISMTLIILLTHIQYFHFNFSIDLF